MGESGRVRLKWPGIAGWLAAFDEDITGLLLTVAFGFSFSRSLSDSEAILCSIVRNKAEVRWGVVRAWQRGTRLTKTLPARI
jgi:hypothetical protein